MICILQQKDDYSETLDQIDLAMGEVSSLEDRGFVGMYYKEEKEKEK